MTKKRPVKPQPGDDDLWRRLTAGVKPLPRAAPAPKPPPPPKSAARLGPPPPAAKTKPPPAPKPSKTPKPFAGLDKRNADRLRRGEWPIDGTLDLHNMTQAAAHAALRSYLGRAWAAGQRCILVITGKGSPRPVDDGLFGEERGVLKRMLPRWLADPALQPLILATAPAQQRHGGGGAFYVLLRRQRGS